MFQCSCQKRRHHKPPEKIISPIIPVSDQYRPINSRLVLDPDVFLVISCLEVSTYVYFCYKKVIHFHEKNVLCSTDFLLIFMHIIVRISWH